MKRKSVIDERKEAEVKEAFERMSAFNDALNHIKELYMTIEIGRLVIPSALEKMAEQLGDMPEPMKSIIESMFGIKKKTGVRPGRRRKKETIDENRPIGYVKRIDGGEN